jgi:hypothetical protein
MFLNIARQVVAELTSVGIQATLSTPPGNVLYGQELAAAGNPTAGGQPGQAGPDIVVGPQAVGGDVATDLASQFGCAPTQTSASTPPPSNVFGWCDSTLQSTIQAALTGEMSAADALTKVEPTLWADDVEVPLFQFSAELVTTPKVTGVSVGAPLAGPFVAAPNWNLAPN